MPNDNANKSIASPTYIRSNIVSAFPLSSFPAVAGRESIVTFASMDPPPETAGDDVFGDYPSVFAPSKSKFSSNTFTAGSPRNPRKRP